MRSRPGWWLLALGLCLPACGEPSASLPRGLAWVRSQPMFVSGLSVFLGPPPARFVDEYFDDFHASAAHLWQSGLPTELGGWAAAAHPAFRWVSWVLPDGTSADDGQLAGGLGAESPGRIGYQIADEPRGPEELASFQTGLDALRAHDPGALLIVNFLAWGTEEMVERYAAHMGGDVISYDRYDRTSDTYADLALFRRQGLAHGLPYWRYLNAFMFSDLADLHHESDMRWDAFVGLVFGYTGHTWFLYQIRGSPDLVPLFFQTDAAFDAPKTEKWALAARINAELRNLGRAVTQLTSTDVRYVPAQGGDPPPGLTRWAPGAGGDGYLAGVAAAPGQEPLELLVGLFRDDAGEGYVMVQNVRHEHGDPPSRSHAAGAVLLTFDFAGAPAGLDRTALLGLDKLTGQVVELPLTGGQGEGASLEVTLAAGDPVLFKYADGAPFALGP